MKVKKCALGEKGEITRTYDYGELPKNEAENLASMFADYISHLISAGGHVRVLGDKAWVKTANEKIEFTDATTSEIGQILDISEAPSEKLISDLDEMIAGIAPTESQDFEREFEQL